MTFSAKIGIMKKAYDKGEILCFGRCRWKGAVMLETNKLVRKLSIGNQKLRALSQEDVAAIQAVLLEMMSDFDAFCRQNGLQYFLCGGSLLGAVRHQGFIPWDEDVDIAMPRADYNRMQALFEQSLGERYWLQSLDTSATHDLPFMKIRKKGTLYLEIFDTEPERAGVFIDIYPLENIPDFFLWRWAHGLISDFLHLCCSCVRVKEKKQIYFEYFGALRPIRIKAALGTCLSFLRLQRWCRMADGWASLCRNAKSKRVSFPGGRKHYFGEIFHRENLLPLREAPFEDCAFFIPAEPSEPLKVLYGDYAVIPPEDRRERHTIRALSLDED